MSRIRWERSYSCGLILKLFSSIWHWRGPPWFLDVSIRRSEMSWQPWTNVSAVSCCRCQPVRCHEALLSTCMLHYAPAVALHIYLPILGMCQQISHFFTIGISANDILILANNTCRIVETGSYTPSALSTCSSYTTLGEYRSQRFVPIYNTTCFK